MKFLANEVEAVAADWRSKSPEEVLEARNTVFAKIDRAYDQMGPENDFSKITEFSGEAADKKLALFKAGTELAALNKVVNEQVQLSNIRSEMANARKPTAITNDLPVRFEMEDLSPQAQIGRALDQNEAFQNAFTQRGGLQHAIGTKFHLDLDPVNTLFQTSAGWAPQIVRSGRVALTAQEPPKVMDLLPAMTTRQAGYAYMEETTYTNAAAPTAEAAALPESALQLTPRSESLEAIGTVLPATMQQLQYIDEARSYIQNRLPLMVRQAVDAQVINGNGTSPNIAGVIGTTRTSIATQAKGTDSTMDQIRKAITKIRHTAQAEPTGVALNSTDSESIYLEKDSTGRYKYLNPGTGALFMPWGLRFVEANRLTAGTGIVADFMRHTAFIYRTGVTVEVTDTHQDDFSKLRYMFRAYIFCCVAVFRPTAVVQLTGVAA